MDRLKVLHIILDDKFFDSVFNKFEKSQQFENIALLFVKKIENYQFQYIKNRDKVKLVDKKGFIKILLNNVYDIVFLHSLPVCLYKYVRIIPKDKVIIWWGWGYDIYDSVYGMEPLLNVNLYKPLTLSILNNKKELFSHIK